MNKRGDISITILVVGIVAVCFFALASFAFSVSNTFNFFNGINLIEKVSARAELGNDFDGHNVKGNYWVERKIKNGFLLREDKMIFEVKYYSP